MQKNQTAIDYVPEQRVKSREQRDRSSETQTSLSKVTTYKLKRKVHQSLDWASRGRIANGPNFMLNYKTKRSFRDVLQSYNTHSSSSFKCTKSIEYQSFQKGVDELSVD